MKTLSDWEKRLESMMPPDQIRLGFSGIKPVFDRLAVSVEPKKVIVVAGTNGKGSFVEAISVLAMSSDLRVGQFTSPHLHHFSERIRINGSNVSQDLLVSALDKVDLARKNIEITYFEFLTLAAFVIFSEENIDLWVLEIGLGGRLDAVNILDSSIQVITSIGLDHQSILGESIPEIAIEKAGIMRPKGLCLSSATNAMETLTKEAEKIGSELWMKDHNFRIFCGSGDSFRIEFEEKSVEMPYPLLPLDSVVLAVIAAYKKGFLIDPNSLSKLSKKTLAGRFEQKSIGGINWLLDVAHNPAAVRFLKNRLAGRQVVGKKILILGIMKSKDARAIVAEVAPITDFWILVGIDRNRGWSPQKLEQIVMEVKPTPSVKIFKSVIESIDWLEKRLSRGDEVLIMGSFLLVAEARKHAIFV